MHPTSAGGKLSVMGQWVWWKGYSYLYGIGVFLSTAGDATPHKPAVALARADGQNPRARSWPRTAISGI